MGRRPLSLWHVTAKTSETREQLTPLFETFPEDFWYHGECRVGVPTTFLFYSLNHSFMQPFRRLPTEQEWPRSRGYAQRMRRLDEDGDLYLLPSEFLSVLHFRAFNSLPNLKPLRLNGVAENFVCFISLLLPPESPPSISTLDQTSPKEWPLQWSQPSRRYVPTCG